MLGRSPHSLLEGLAMYEEDSYLRTLGVHLTLGSIAHLYANGGFPSATDLAHARDRLGHCATRPRSTSATRTARRCLR